MTAMAVEGTGPRSDAFRASEAPEKSCAVCRSTYSEAAWHALPVLATLGQTEIGAHVDAWPDRRVVEVRACSRCDHRMARSREPT